MDDKVNSMDGWITALQGQATKANKTWPTPVIQPQVAATGPQATQIRRLGVKLTEFNTEKAEMWFEETERALVAANITESTQKVVVIQKYIPEQIHTAKRNIFQTKN